MRRMPTKNLIYRCLACGCESNSRKWHPFWCILLPGMIYLWPLRNGTNEVSKKRRKCIKLNHKARITVWLDCRKYFLLISRCVSTITGDTIGRWSLQATIDFNFHILMNSSGSYGSQVRLYIPYTTNPFSRHEDGRHELSSGRIGGVW